MRSRARGRAHFAESATKNVKDDPALTAFIVVVYLDTHKPNQKDGGIYCGCKDHLIHVTTEKKRHLS